MEGFNKEMNEKLETIENKLDQELKQHVRNEIEKINEQIKKTKDMAGHNKNATTRKTRKEK